MRSLTAVLGAASLAWLAASCTDSPRFYEDAGTPDGGLDEAMSGWGLACAVRAGGAEHDQPTSGREGGDEISIFENGSSYLVGSVAEAATFGFGEPNETQFPSGVGWSDGFIARYAPDCTLDWVRRIGGNDEDHAHDVTILEDGSAVVVGIIRSGEVVLGAGEPSETTLTSPWGLTTGYVARYRSDGGLLWAVQIPQTDETHVYARTVHAMPDGRILVSGTLRGTAWPGEPFEVVSETSDSMSEWDGYLAWFDANGEVDSAIRIGDDVQTPELSVTALADGEVVAAMPYGYSELFGAGEPNETTLTCPLQEDDNDCSSLAKYNAEGGLIWVKDLGVTKSHSWHVTESIDGSIVLTGVFSYDPTDSDFAVPGFALGEDEKCVLVAKLDSDDGALEWVRLGKTGPFVPSRDSFGSIPMPDGGIVAMMTFNPTLEFEGGDAGQLVLTSEGNKDIALVRFSKDGEILLMYRMGNEGDDGVIAGAQLDGNSIWLTGAYSSNPLVATSEHDDDIPLPLSGIQDIFLMRFDATTIPTE
jgi:hypothetical protein